MSRRQLQLECYNIYHIWTHANDDENLFLNKENYRYFLQKYKKHIHPVAETFAYCLMPNHLHLMIRVRDAETLVEYGRKKTQKTKALKDYQNPGVQVSQQLI